MENATKALLIAAAVLVAILIISLGLMIFNNASDVVTNNANLSEYEIQAFNDKFLNFQGESVSGTRVNSLIRTAFNSNLSEEDEGRKIEIAYKSSDTGGESLILQRSSSIQPSRLDTGARYKVVATYDENSKLINKITITKN